MLITKSDAARLLNISRNAVQKWENQDSPPQFFVFSNGKTMVDDSHPEWLNKLNAPKKTNKNKSLSRAANKKETMKKAIQPKPDTDETEHKKPDRTYVPPVATPEMEELIRQAAIAEMEDVIFAAEIKKQKAEQEKLKTLEQKKDLANIDLMIHFFSFTENIIQRWYRRPHELSPQLSALYLAGEEKKAEQLLLKELEGIVKDTQKDLIKALEEEGLRIEHNR
jgi:hypothetical protein